MARPEKRNEKLVAVRVIVTQSAKEDVFSAFSFYEMQQEKLGHRFLAVFEKSVDELADTAGIHPVVLTDIHRKLMSSFPHAIYYRISKNIAYVHAVLDCRMNPKNNIKRLIF